MELIGKSSDGLVDEHSVACKTLPLIPDRSHDANRAVCGIAAYQHVDSLSCEEFDEFGFHDVECSCLYMLVPKLIESRQVIRYVNAGLVEPPETDQLESYQVVLPER